MALSRLVTPSISSLPNKNILQPYIDSDSNHIRHFIKIQFVNMGI